MRDYAIFPDVNSHCFPKRQMLECFMIVGNQTLCKFPPMTSLELFALKEIGDGVMADSIPMLCQVRAGVVGNGVA
jgi:hypothetical protein